MNEKIKADNIELKNEASNIIHFLNKQIDAFTSIKKIIENIQWADSKYDNLIICMNDIGSSISNLIQELTNGRDVYILSELMVLLDQYIDLASDFPKIE